jgi:uracil-DNA glycosylase family protein
VGARGRDLEQLRAEASACTMCDLYEHATQTVFGEGPASARAVMIGEQPGDREDVEGRPFVGPAGRVLDDALADAGIARDAVYLTNAVKHFKWTPRGKRRLHQKPNAREIRACRPWWEREVDTIDPDVVLCLGATAAQAVLGASFRLTQHRGEWQRLGDRRALATIHPSAVLRGEEERDALYDGLVADLRLVAGVLGRGAKG